MSKLIYRLYIAEYEQAESWMAGGSNQILKYLKPYDMYIVYMTGRSKLPFERYRRILDGMGEQCFFVDARQMPDAELHKHMLDQITIYANENTHIYFLCNPQDYQALRNKITTGIEISLKSNFRTGRFDPPPDYVEEIQPEEIAADIIPPSLFASDLESDEKQYKKELSSSSESVKLSCESSKSNLDEKTTNSKTKSEKKTEDESGTNKQTSAQSSRHNKNKKPKFKKRNLIPNKNSNDDTKHVGNDIPDAPMQAFISMFGDRIGDDSQRAPASTPNPEKKENAKFENISNYSDPCEPANGSMQSNSLGTEFTVGSIPQSKARFAEKGDDHKPKESWKERISGDNDPKSRTSGSASIIQDIEKAIFGTKQAYAEITKEYTDLDDSKARTVSLMSDRLINDINILIKDIKKYDFSYDSYMELISTLIRSDNLNDFKEGWGVVHPGCELNITEQIYTSLYKEACHYAKTCEVLYSEDLW